MAPCTASISAIEFPSLRPVCPFTHSNFVELPCCVSLSLILSRIASTRSRFSTGRPTLVVQLFLIQPRYHTVTQLNEYSESV